MSTTYKQLLSFLTGTSCCLTSYHCASCQTWTKGLVHASRRTYFNPPHNSPCRSSSNTLQLQVSVSLQKKWTHVLVLLPCISISVLICLWITRTICQSCYRPCYLAVGQYPKQARSRH